VTFVPSGSAFDLNFTDHLGHPIHHVVAIGWSPVLHQIDLGRPSRTPSGSAVMSHRLGYELEAALLPSARHIGCGKDQELFDFSRSQVHGNFSVTLRGRQDAPLDGKILLHDVLAEVGDVAVGDDRPLFHHIKRIRQSPSEF
jgi:hypothetical protein